MKKVKVTRKPEIRVTSKGVRVSRGTLRVGGKVGLTIGRRGIGLNIKTKRGTISSRRGILISSVACLIRGKKKRRK